MQELMNRFPENPLLRPTDAPPSRADMVVECLLNPGAFRYQGKTGLLLRVAERPQPEEGWVSTPVLDPTSEGGIRTNVSEIRKEYIMESLNDIVIWNYHVQQ